MVLIALNRASQAIDNRIAILFSIGDGLLFAGAVAVRLDVRFVKNVETVFVGEVVPLRHIRIMAGSNGIDVVLLHQLDVLDHHFARHDLAGIGVEFVTVHSLDHQLLAVEQNLIAL